MRQYYFRTATGFEAIRHGRGFNWGDEYPLDFDVWESIEYAEARLTDTVNGNIPILDARGRKKDNTRWRSLGKRYETASYEDVDEETAKRLDAVLDDACIRKTSH